MTCRRAFVLLVALLTAGAATAQTDLTGTWDITAQMSLAVDEVPSEPDALCDYTGTGEMTQSGDDVTGPISLTQTTSVMDCPPTLVGDFAGSVIGSDLMGTITSGMESSTVTGIVTGGAAPAAAVPSGALMIQKGGLNVTAGPFAGTNGSFTATIQAAPMPTAGPGMLVALALLLLIGGSLLISRRSRAA